MNNDEAKNLSSLILESLKTRGLSVEKLSQLSGVPEKFIVLLIEDRIEKMPSRPYTHGYILKLGEALGFDGEKLWRDSLKNNEMIKRSGKNDQLPQNRFAIPKLNKRALLIFLISIFVLIYLFARLPSLLGKPKITFLNLEEKETTVQNKNFTIRGTIEPGSKLTINNEIVYPERNGDFEKSLELEPGFNAFNFKVKKFLGKERLIAKQIFYQAPEAAKLEKTPVIQKENQTNPTSTETQNQNGTN